MIDFHTHILPQIDDGASSLEESLALMGELETQGVDTVIFTPHYYGRNKSVQRFLEKRNAAYERFVGAYTGKIKTRKGCECNLSTCANRDLDDLLPLAVEGTDYILIEMSFAPQWSEDMWERLFRLMDSTGLTPVIAHVELYPAIEKNPEYAYRLIQSGCLLQMNCTSVLNASRKDLSYALLAHHQIHCLGSDTHNTTVRPPLYAQAVSKLTEEFGQEYVAALQGNMQKIVHNEKVSLPSSEPVKKRLFRYV